MTLLPFNVNHCVRVKLTDYGRTILRQNHEEVRGLLPKGVRFNYPEPKEDADGWSSHQLWQLMVQFGQYMHNGGKLPFETEILIETEDKP